LFQGTATTLKHESNPDEGGFGTPRHGVRYSIPKSLYFGKFKKPGLIGGLLNAVKGVFSNEGEQGEQEGSDLEYERPELPEETEELLKRADSETYRDSKGRTLPKR
jgi:hypothetical protein